MYVTDINPLTSFAVRSLIDGNDHIFNSAFGKKIYNLKSQAITRLSSFNDSWWSFSDKAHEIANRVFLLDGAYGKCSSDPFLLDAIDLLDILVADDQDRAKLRNNIGLSKSSSPEGHRLIAQINMRKIITPKDIDTLKDIVSPMRTKSHFTQITKKLSEHTNMSADEIDLVLRARYHRNEIFSSERIKSITDSDYDFANDTFAWSAKQEVRVHCSSECRDEVEDFRAFLSDSSQYAEEFQGLPKIDGRNAKRIINGEEIPYSYKGFPISAAGEVLSFVSKLSSPRAPSIICPSLISVAKSLDPASQITPDTADAIEFPHIKM